MFKSLCLDRFSHPCLPPSLPDGFLLSLTLHSVRRTAVGQFLGLLLASVSENICVCSGAVVVDHCNCCLGL